MPDASPAEAAEGATPAEGEGKTPAGETPPTGTPEEPDSRTYPESYVKQLRKESSDSRKKNAELEARLQEIEDREKTETERTAERATAAERRAAEAETRLLRFEVARERGLDLAAAHFLTGSTREEIELRAEELDKLLTERSKPPATFDGGARKTPPETRSPDEAHNELIMRSLGHTPARER